VRGARKGGAGLFHRGERGGGGGSVEISHADSLDGHIISKLQREVFTVEEMKAQRKGEEYRSLPVCARPTPAGWPESKNVTFSTQ